MLRITLRWGSAPALLRSAGLPFCEPADRCDWSRYRAVDKCDCVACLLELPHVFELGSSIREWGDQGLDTTRSGFRSMVGLPAGPLRRAVLEQVLAVDVPDPELAEQVAAWEQEKAVLDGGLVVELAEPARRRPTNSVNSANSVRLRGVDEFAADELALMLRLAPRAARTAANQPNSATSTIAGPGSTAESPPPASKCLLHGAPAHFQRWHRWRVILVVLPTPLVVLVLSSGGQM